jgi:hypothetical protein
MVRMLVLRMSTSLAVGLAAGAVLVATGSAATATQGQPVIAGQYSDATATTTIQNKGAGNGLTAAGFDGTGVEGDGATGVHGSGAVNGVFGSTDNSGGSGVYGQNDGTGYGVAGRAANGTGMLADSASGTALKVTGRSKFSTAGTAVIGSGLKSATVTLAGVTPSDFVLAMVQGKGSFYVKNASAGSGSFTIYINKAPTAPATVTVAYFVISAS